MCGIRFSLRVGRSLSIMSEGVKRLILIEVGIIPSMGYTMGSRKGSGDVLYACVQAREPGLVFTSNLD